MPANERVGAERAPSAGRPWPAPAIAIALIVLLSLRLTAQAPSANWSQFRGNARLTGTATTAPPATLTLKWTYEAGESIESSAAIVDGTVYVGSTKGELLAIALERCKLRCRSTTGPGPS